MNETLEQLQADLQASLEEMKTQEEVLGDESLSGDAFKEANERFEAAHARSGELTAKIREMQSNHEVARAREAAKRAAAERREDAAKLQEELNRRPNMKARTARELTDARLGSGSFARDMSLALAAWSNYRVTERNIDPESLEAAKRVGINIAHGELNLNRSNEFKVWFHEHLNKIRGQGEDLVPMAGSTDPLDSRDGQFAGILNRPPVQIQQLAINTYSTNGILKAPVTVVTTEHGDEIEQAYFDDMMNDGVKNGEGRSVLNVVQGNAGKITWRAYRYSSKSISYTWESMRKSRFDLPEQTPRLLGERLGRITGQAFTNGSGAAGYPQGIVTFATDGGLSSTCETANAISVNDIRYLTHNSVDHMFLEQNPEKVGWMMGRATFAYLGTKKDGQGRPYYEMSKEMVNGRMVFMLEGYPVYINYDMPAFSWTTGTTLLLFGDFSRFAVRYAFGSSIPVIIRDDVSGINELVTKFSAVQWVDSRGENYGNPPIAKLVAA